MSESRMDVRPEDKRLLDLFIQDFWRVPDFQREFVWGAKKEVARLIDDLVQAYREGLPDYFLGSVVFFIDKDGKHALVDGQQRLTTLLLLIAALRDRLSTPLDPMNQAIRAVNPGRRSGDQDFRLELQSPETRKVFENLCTQRRSELKPEKAGARKFLIQAFDKCASSLASEFGEDAESELLDFWDFIWKQAHVVSIRTPDLKSAYKIFETLNDRGKALDASDLLRNYLFRSASDDTQEVLQKEWKSLAKVLRDAGEANQIRFLRYYLMATYGLAPGEAGGKGDEGRDKVIRADQLFEWIGKHEGLIGAATKPEVFAGVLKDAAVAYVNFLAGRDASGTSHSALQNIGFQKTRVRQHLCLLLAARNLSGAAFTRLAESLECLTLAYAVAGVPWNSLEAKLPAWSAKIRSAGSVADIEAFVAAEVVPSIAEHSTKFWEQIDRLYSVFPNLAKYVLARLTARAQEAAVAGGTMEQLMEKNWSVEHILPRSVRDLSKLDSDLVKDFGVASAAQAIPYVERLGNLCLVSWGANSEASDHTYALRPEGAAPKYQVKRDLLAHVPWLLTYAIAKTPVTPKSGKPTTRLSKFVKQYGLTPPAKHWNPSEVERRHAYLVQMISDLWPLLPDRPSSVGGSVSAEESAVSPANPEDELVELIAAGESETREFKSTFVYDTRNGGINTALLTPMLRTATAFMNCNGGKIIVGVSDAGEVLGLAKDLELDSKGTDGLDRRFFQALINATSPPTARLATLSFVVLGKEVVGQIEVEPSREPVFLSEKDGSKGFYIRVGASTQPLDMAQAKKHIDSRW